MTSDFADFTARLREFIASFPGGHGSVSALTCSPTTQTDATDQKQSSDGALPSNSGVFNELALELFALQFAHNAPYRRFCETRRVSPQNVTDWAQIPAVPTAAFKEVELTCLSAAERTVVFHSSGTTEQRPSRHFHSAESLAVYEASLLPWFERHMAPDFGFRISDFGFAVLTPPPTQAPHSSLVHMFETVRRAFGVSDSVFAGEIGRDGEWTLGFEAALAHLRHAREDERPLILLGTAFAFMPLLDALAEANLSFELPLGSRVLETGGYKGRSRSLPKAELHALIARGLGIPASHIVCEYGMSELSSQAYDGVAGDACRVTGDVTTSRPASRVPRHFLFPPWARVQVVSPETGREVGESETGLIRVFDLANVFSVLAVQTEDLGVHRGDGFEFIGRAELSEPRGCSLMNVEPLNR